MRRYEIHTLAVAYHQIARHDGRASDAHRDVDAGKHHIFDRGWIDVLEICGHGNLRYAVQVADAPVHHQAAALSCGHHVVEKIVSHDGPAHLLAEQVDHQHISRPQHVDRGLVMQRPDTALLGFGFGYVLHVGPHRHELDGKRAPDHWLVRVQDAETIRVLVLVAFLLEHLPDLFGGKFARLADQIVGDVGPAVRQTVKWIGLGIFD